MLSLSYFGIYDLLVFVLIFAIVYAVLSKAKFFVKPDIPALIAVAVAMLALTSSFFVTFVVAFLPYVLAVLVFIFLILLLMSTATFPQEAISTYLKKSSLIPALLIFLLFLFALLAYGYAASQFPPSNATPPVTCLNCNTTTTGGSTPTTTSGSNTSKIVVRSSMNDLTGSYILSILTAPQVMTLLLTLAAMAVAVYFMTREKK